MKEIALYYPDGVTATRDDVRRKLLAERLTVPFQRTPSAKPRTFQEWRPILERRKKEHKELISLPEMVEVEIATRSPLLIGLFGDVHAEAADCNLERFGKDIDLIKEVSGYFMTFGDLTNSIFWKHEASLADQAEANLYMESALQYMAEDGHLLCSWMGDHEGWIYDKFGAHSLYWKHMEKYKAHLLDGVSYVDLALNNGEETVKYAIIGSHRHKGFSVYNDAHASWRQQLDEANTSRNIISITAHKHTKAYLQQTRKVFGGDERRIHAISLGTNKETDRHSRKHGWPRKGEETAGAFGVVLHPEEDRIQVFWELENAVKYLASKG